MFISLDRISSRFIVLFVSALLLPTFLLAEEEKIKETAADEVNEEDIQLAGHSYHGEVFNEGPRQKAYLMGGTGNVHFPIKTKSEDTQKFFDQGIGQLHGFWYLEAERSFRHAASLDPDCAMAYWGAAYANLKNTERAEGFIEEAIERKENASEREKLYIAALEKYIEAKPDKKKERNEAYTKALENIILKNPDDLEAKAFLALHLYSSRSGASSYFAINALIEDILEEEPFHPVHHFRIHLWDHKDPKSALSSAAKGGQSAPNIAHMWHMPGHIYSRLKRYDDAAWQQEASARVDHAHMMKDRLLPDEIHNFAHNNEWLIRNLVFLGRVHDAVSLAKNMIELPQHPKYNTFEKRGSARHGRQRLIQVLESYQLWDEILALEDSPYLQPTDVDEEQVNRLRILGIASFYAGKTEQGNQYIKQLEKRVTKVETAQAKAAEEAKKKAEEEKKEKKEIEKTVADAKKKPASKIKTLKYKIDELKGFAAFVAEDYTTAYEQFKKAKIKDKLILMQAQWHAGETEKSEKAFRDYIKSHQNEVLPRVAFVNLLSEVGEQEKAIAEFKELAKISSHVDLDVPLIANLDSIAKAAGFNGDWRAKKKLSIDLSTRPELDSLGPFRWQPSAAPSWELVDETGAKISYKQWQGKPHVLIFYLGYQCLHCADQLQAFAPKVKQFKEAGFDVVAISTDDQAGLLKSIEMYTEEKLPIKLVSDGELNAFKAFRVFDDFEDQPLHGTFVIDAKGRVLWQDISYEPFMKADFLLNEATRLTQQQVDNKHLQVQATSLNTK